MKKILLLAIISTFSAGVWAECSTAKIPKIKGMDSITYDSKGRSSVLKNGWKPIPLSKQEQEDMPFFDKKTPEKYCSATMCISVFQDNKNNELTVTQVGDFISGVEVECSSKPQKHP